MAWKSTNLPYLRRLVVGPVSSVVDEAESPVSGCRLEEHRTQRMRCFRVQTCRGQRAEARVCWPEQPTGGDLAITHDGDTNVMQSSIHVGLPPHRNAFWIVLAIRHHPFELDQVTGAKLLAGVLGW